MCVLHMVMCTAEAFFSVSFFLPSSLPCHWEEIPVWICEVKINKNKHKRMRCMFPEDKVLVYSETSINLSSPLKGP